MIVKCMLLSGLILLGGGCAAHNNVTFSSPSRTLDQEAAATVEDVHLTADADEWSGNPPHLDEIVPVLVTIENDSDRPLRVRYQEFALVAPTGVRSSALPPFDPEKVASATPRRYPYAWYGFHVAPHIGTLFRGFWTGGWEFDYDAKYHETQYNVLAGAVEPTADMTLRALPEGVLEPGGRIMGFLYFERPDTGEEVTLIADLIDAESGEPFGSVGLPMAAASR